MASRSESLWRHPVLEGFAVLVGILIAFALEAGWQERSEHDAETTYLIALHSELEDAHAYFLGRDEALAAEIDLADRVRLILNSSAALDMPDDSVNALAMALGPVAVEVPPRAVLDDLVSSGGIGTGRSETLRRAVATYVQALEADVRAQEAAVDLWLSHVAPYRYSHSTLAIGIAVAPWPDLPISVDREAFVGARQYTNLLTAWILRTRDVRTTQEAARVEVENLLDVLSALGITSAP